MKEKGPLDTKVLWSPLFFGMKVASLFSGIGGLDLGLQRAGHTIILQCDSDPRAQQVLQSHFKGARFASHVESLAELPPDTQLLAAGFPCQDVSINAPHRVGLRGSRSSLVEHVFRLLKRQRVPAVLLETVPGALLPITRNTPAGPVLQERPLVHHLAKSFTELGYQWAYRTIDTRSFGIPQRRRRVFFLALLYGYPRDVLLSQVSPAEHGRACSCVRCFLSTAATREPAAYALDLSFWNRDGDVDTTSTLTRVNAQRTLLVLPSRKRRTGSLDVRNVEELQGFPPNWTLPCGSGNGAGQKLPPEAAVRARYALVGNAVSVPVAYWLGRALRHPLRYKYLHGPTDRPLRTKSGLHEGGKSCQTRQVELSQMPKRQRSEQVRRGPSRAGGRGEAIDSSSTCAAGSAPPVGASQFDSEGAGEGPGAAAAATSMDVTLPPPLGPWTPTLGHNAEDAAANVGPTKFSSLRDSATHVQSSGRPASGACSFPPVVDGSWPQAGWGGPGEGCFEATGLLRAPGAEHPVLQPYTPLHEFLPRVGEAPDRTQVQSYLQRMREGQWELAGAVRSALIAECGAQPADFFVRSAERPLVDRHLVWAKCAGYTPAFWPAMELSQEDCDKETLERRTSMASILVQFQDSKWLWVSSVEPYAAERERLERQAVGPKWRLNFKQATTWAREEHRKRSESVDEVQAADHQRSLEGSHIDARAFDPSHSLNCGDGLASPPKQKVILGLAATHVAETRSDSVPGKRARTNVRIGVPSTAANKGPIQQPRQRPACYTFRVV